MTREEAIRCLSVHSSTNGSGLRTDEQHYEAKQMAIRSLKAWKKVKEELKEEMTGLDMFIEKEHTIRWCLHVIDEALGEAGEQDG